VNPSATYDILRTTTQTIPTGIGNFAVAKNTASTQIIDKSNTLATYVVTTSGADFVTTNETAFGGGQAQITRYNGNIVNTISGFPTVNLNVIAGSAGYPTIAIAGAAAQSQGGCLVIPANYIASDVWSNPSNICVEDFRGGAGFWRGESYVTDYGAAMDGITDSSASFEACATQGTITGIPCVIPASPNPYILQYTVGLKSSFQLEAMGNQAPAPNPEIDYTGAPGTDAFANIPTITSYVPTWTAISKVSIKNLRLVSRQTPISGNAATIQVVGGNTQFTITAPTVGAYFTAVPYSVTSYWTAGDQIIASNIKYPQVITAESHVIPGTPFRQTLAYGATNRSFDCGTFASGGCSNTTVYDVTDSVTMTASSGVLATLQYSENPATGQLTFYSGDAGKTTQTTYTYYNTGHSGQFTIGSVSGDGTTTLTIKTTTAGGPGLTTLLPGGSIVVGAPITYVTCVSNSCTLSSTLFNATHQVGRRLMLEGFTAAAIGLNDQECLIVENDVAGSITCNTDHSNGSFSVAQTGVAILASYGINIQDSSNGNNVSGNQIMYGFWDDIFFGGSYGSSCDLGNFDGNWSISPLGYGLEIGSISNYASITKQKCDLYTSSAKACVRLYVAGQTSPPGAVIKIDTMKVEVGEPANAVQVDTAIGLLSVNNILMSGNYTLASGNGGDLLQVNGMDGQNIYATNLTASLNNGIYPVCLNAINITARGTTQNGVIPCTTSGPVITSWTGSVNGFCVNGSCLQGVAGTDDTLTYGRSYFKGSLLMGPLAVASNIATTFPSGTASLNIQPQTSGTSAIHVQAISGQSANLEEWQNTAGTALASISGAGLATVTKFATVANCAVNSVSPAACGSAASGAFVIPTATVTYTVNTTAVTVNSVIILTPRTYATGLPSTPTCVTPLLTTDPVVSAIVAGASFSVALPSTTGQTCWNYFVIN
jgi:hypothetical protein